MAFPVMLVLCSIALSARTPRLVEDTDERKADYIFLEALRHKGLGNSDAYYDLVERAYEINPKDKFIGKEYGSKLIILTQDDSAAVEEGMRLIGNYVKSEPSDLYSGITYAQLSNHLGDPDEAVATMGKLYEVYADRIEVALRYVDALIANADSLNTVKALALIDTLERSEGINPELSMRRMRIYDGDNDTMAIRAEVRKLVNSAPQRVEYNTFAGQMFMNLGEPDSARVYFDQAVELDPTSGVAYFNRAAFYNQLGDSAAYDREVFQAMAQQDLDVEPKLEILRDYVIKLYTDSTQHERIANLFHTLIDMYPHEPTVRNFYASYLIAVKDYAGAAEQKSYELDMTPGDEDEWVVLSSLYLQTNDFAKVKSTADRGLHYFPNETSLYELASAASLSMGDSKEALSYIERGMATVDSTDYAAVSRLIGAKGDVFYKEELLDSAFTCYNQAIELDASNLTALNNCAYYLACSERDLDKALELIEKVVKERESDPTSLDTYAWVLFKRKEYEKAREIIDSALENSEEESAELYEHAGDIYFMDGMPEEALEYWKKASTLAPDNKLLKRKVKHKTFFYK